MHNQPEPARPIVDRSEPFCPQYEMELDPRGPELCPRCRRAFTWVEIDEPEIFLADQQCYRCGYDLTGNVSERCPECGTPFPRDLEALVEAATGMATVDANDDDAARISVNSVVGALVDCRGGICYVDDETESVLPLPIAGLMSDLAPEEIARRYAEIDRLAKRAGSTLSAPFMTLSFMALLVIPKLKLSDQGLFDAERFAFVE